MKRKHFLLFWIITILLTCAACTEADGINTNTDSNAQTGTVQTTVSSTDTAGSEKTDLSDTSAEGSATPSDSATDSATDSTDVVTSATNEPTDTSSSVSTDTSSGSASTSTQKPNTSTSTQKPNTSTTTSSKPTVSTTVSTNTGNGGTNNGGTPSDEPLHTIAPENYYGRAWLATQANGASLVSAYDQMVTAAESMSGSVTLKSTVNPDQFYTVFHCYVNDYPEHFWVDHNYTYSHSGNAVKTFTLKYTMSAAEKATAKKEFDKAVDNLLDGLNGSMSQFDLERTLHDRLVLGITYKEGTHAHDAYGAIVEHTAVCEGYARAFQLLCRKVGIRALIAEGSATDPATGKSIGHAWNVVQINGDFYHIDVTWDDAGEPDDEHGIHYAWFNITSKQLTEDHILGDSGYDIPKCDNTEENFFLKTGRYIDKLTVDNLLKVLELHGDEYHAHVYLKETTDVKTWFQNNLFEILSELEIYNRKFSLQTTGHGFYVIIKPL